MRDSMGLVKVGLAFCALSRRFFVQSVVPAAHRPVYLVHTVMVRLDLAYKVERLAQFFLSERRVKHGNFTEWFRTTPTAASIALRDATAAVLAAEQVFGRRFPWRKALPFSRRYKNDDERLTAIEKRTGKKPGRTWLRGKFGSPHKEANES